MAITGDGWKRQRLECQSQEHRPGDDPEEVFLAGCAFAYRDVFHRAGQLSWSRSAVDDLLDKVGASTFMRKECIKEYERGYAE